MDGTSPCNLTGPEPDRGCPARAGWGWAVGLGFVLILIYLANGGEPSGADDTEPATYIPLAILRGDGPYLDRFEPLLRTDQGRLSWCVARSRGHVVSRYPLAPALVAVPLVWPQVVLLDRLRPGWDRSLPQARFYCRRMAKVTAAGIAALTGVVLYLVLVRAGLGRVAFLTVLAASLGSELWMIASQCLWQHGPAALALVLAIRLLGNPPQTGPRLLLAGLACGVMVACRAIDVVFAGAMACWVAFQGGRKLAWFVPFPLLVGTLLVGSNLWFFGTLSGGQAQLEALHLELHGIAGSWTANPGPGAAGTLLSPGRGLFVYCPWVLVALVAIPAVRSRLREWPLLGWLLAALIPFLGILSTYTVWWAGHCFGPRYWTDATPIFALLLALVLDWARRQQRVVLVGAQAAIAFSVAVQCLGACAYPSSWNDRPNDVDRHPERLWSWRDQELSRCLAEGQFDPARRLPRSLFHGIALPSGEAHAGTRTAPTAPAERARHAPVLLEMKRAR